MLILHHLLKYYTHRESIYYRVCILPLCIILLVYPSYHHILVSTACILQLYSLYTILLLFFLQYVLLGYVDDGFCAFCASMLLHIMPAYFNVISIVLGCNPINTAFPYPNTIALDRWVRIRITCKPPRQVAVNG